MKLDRNVLQIDSPAEIERISAFIRDQVAAMRRSGVVIGLSGGIDSAVCSALCARALGTDKVRGLILPERESDPRAADYGIRQAQRIGIPYQLIDITPSIEGFGAYEKRDEAIAEVFPEYGPQWKSKIVLPADLLSRGTLNFFTLKVMDVEGNVKSARLNNEVLRRIVAATDIKQRSRMVHLYYQAERENLLVCGTTNRSETVQGFFVKYGDGGVDIEPIAHLYKNQVYQLAEHLDVPREIIERDPSPDTFSFPVTDEEFYFRIPFDQLDLLMYSWEQGLEIAEAAATMGITEEQVGRAFRDFASKSKATAHLRILPPTLEPLVH